MVSGSGLEEVRRVELVAALSLASDLGMGLPLEHGLRGCLLAVRLGQVLGVDQVTLQRVFAVALLRFVGCTAESHAAASYFDDEIAARTATTTLVYAGMPESMAAMRPLVAGESTAGRAATWARLMVTGPRRFREGAQAHCEVGRLLAARLGFDEDTQRVLWYAFERWDGKGFPHRERAEVIPLAARIVHVAHDAAAYHRRAGEGAVVTMLRERAGHGYDPAVVDKLCRDPAEVLACLRSPSVWDDVVAADPGPPVVLRGEELDRALEVVADFADLKSLYTAGHSRAVAGLAARAASRSSFPAAEVTRVRRAGLVHDLGRAAISVHVWDHEGPLTLDQQEKLRLHPYYTERVLARPALLRNVGRLASLHQERLDGSGYPRGMTGDALSASARVLAAADAYQVLIEDRSDRAACPAEAAALVLQEEVRGDPAGGPRARHHPQDREQPHPAHLHQDRGVYPRRRDPVRAAARVAVLRLTGLRRARPGDHRPGHREKSRCGAQAWATRWNRSPPNRRGDPDEHRGQQVRLPPLVHRRRRHRQPGPGRRAADRRLPPALPGAPPAAGPGRAQAAADNVPHRVPGLGGVRRRHRRRGRQGRGAGDRSGTHSGEFQGVPATGRQVVATGIGIGRIADGHIAEAWAAYDALGLLQQLGAADAAPPAPTRSDSVEGSRAG